MDRLCVTDQNRGPMREPASSTQEAAFIADELARLYEGHRRFLARLPQVPAGAFGAPSDVAADVVVVRVMGHRIEASPRPVFKDGRPWYMEYAFAVLGAGEPMLLLTLGLVAGTLYDLTKLHEKLVKINSQRLCQTLVRALVGRLAGSSVVAPKV